MRLEDRNGVVVDIKESSLFFHSEIMPETTMALIADIETREEQIITMYIATPGGCLSCLNVLVEFIRNSDKFFNVKLPGICYSAGYGLMEAIKDFENVVISKVEESAIIMIHQSEAMVSTRDIRNKHTASHFLTNGGNNDLDKYWEDINTRILTEDEIVEFKKGLDIYISPERFAGYMGIPYRDSQKSLDVFHEKATAYFTAEEVTIKCDIDFAEVVDETVVEEEVVEEEVVERVRGFEPVGDTYLKRPEVGYQKPVRSTSRSAGYDVFSTMTVTLLPGQRIIIPTDVKAYMLKDEVLKLFVRSSAGIKKGLALQNGTGIIDADYYSNPDNDGNIGVPLVNTLLYPVEIKVGERIAQCVFQKYLTVDDDNADGQRVGGVGSTGN